MRSLVRRLNSPATRTFSTLVMIAGSVVSKVFGILREFFMAAMFGARAMTDSWLIASITPNLLFGLISNSITNVVVPVLSGHLDVVDENSEAHVYMDEAFTWILAASIFMVAIGEVLSSHIIHWVAPGFTGRRYAMALVMVRIMFPAMPFMAMGALINGILQSRKIFTPATITPIIINVFRLVGIVVLGIWLHIYGVAIGFLLAQIMQVAYLVPVLASQKVRLHLRFSMSHPWTRQSARMAFPFLAAHGANVGGTMVDRIFASMLPVGRIATLNFSNVLSGLPITLLITPVIGPLYSELSSAFNRQDYHAFRKSMQSGFELVTMIILPLALGFILLRLPIVRILYQHGHFRNTSTLTTAHLLLFWSVGLPAQALGTLFSRGLLSQRVTRFSAWSGIFVILCNVVGDFLLVHPLGASGLALATSLAAWVRVMTQGTYLFTHNGNPVNPRAKFVVAELLALAAYVGLLWGGLQLFGLATVPFGFRLLLGTVATGGVGIAAYLAILRLAGVMPQLQRRRSVAVE